MVRNRFFLNFSLLILVLLLISSCSESQSGSPPTITPRPSQTNTPENTPAPEPTATPELRADADTYPAQFRVTTTSIETSLGLLSGANWYDVKIISQSENIEQANFADNRIVLSQSRERAWDEESVWVEVEANLAYLDPETPITFEVQRKLPGQTTVEVFRMEEEGPYEITTFVWDEISNKEGNAEFYEVSPMPFLGSNPNEYVTIAQINFWFYGDQGGFLNPDGSRATPFIPNFGETYWAQDPVWAYQQIEWAVEYGVDAFSVEWTTPLEEDANAPTMELALDTVFLKSPNIHKVRWLIFYDFVLRVYQTNSLADLDPWEWKNFDNPRIYNTFVEDMVHFATKYFHHPQYLTIDGRPVIYVWASGAWYGDYAGAIAEAREKVAELGYDLYIVGDVVCYYCDVSLDLASQFDGNTSFVSMYPAKDQAVAVNDIGEAIARTDEGFTWWGNRIANLRVAGRDDLVNLQPAWSPQYDESWVDIFDEKKTFYAASREQVEQMAEVGRKHTQPVGEEQMKLVWINTWNCWKEATSIEPTIIDDNPKYPGGNYGFDFLEIIRGVYGVETYYTSP